MQKHKNFDSEIYQNKVITMFTLEPDYTPPFEDRVVRHIITKERAIEIIASLEKCLKSINQ